MRKKDDQVGIEDLDGDDDDYEFEPDDEEW